jgi:acetolactate synthase-1/2/3 large subunit
MVDPGMVAYFLQRAFRDALIYPAGPVGVEIPTNLLGGNAGDYPNLRGYLPHGKSAFPAPAGGEPEAIEKAVRMLIDAQKPVVIGGDGIYWSDASNELKEFIELINAPVHTRRMGRGAVPENHPQSFSGGHRGAILKEADVVCILGLRMSMLEHFGMPPTYPMQARYIQISEDQEELTTRLPTEVSIFASPKIALKQMIEVAKEILKGKKPDRAEWLGTIQKLKAESTAKITEQVEKVKNNKPIHPDFLAQEILNTVDKDATIILDSFSMAGFTTDKFQANFAGQMLDSATWGGVGQGVGIGMGAQLGRPGKQVLVLLGDGGLGIAGWDIETAARYNIPVCYLLFNNSAWISDLGQQQIMPDVYERGDKWNITKDVRYDKIFAEMGLHTEYVTEPGQIKPALTRAFNSGKTSFINVIPDNNVIPPQLIGRIKYYQAQFAKKDK